MIKTLWHKILCMFGKHRRGKLLSTPPGQRIYECPLCKKQWTRKTKS